MYNEAQKKATQKYNAKAYDQLKIQVKKGKRELYKEHAKSKGMSLTELIVSLLDKDMEQD